MSSVFRQRLLQAVQDIGGLQVLAGEVPFPSDQADLDLWKDAVRNDGLGILDGDGRGLRTFLRIVREHRDLLESVLWKTGRSLDVAGMDRSLTSALVVECGDPWLELRLRILLAHQENPERAEIKLLLEKLGQDPARLPYLRDAAILQRFGLGAGTKNIDWEEPLACALTETGAGITDAVRAQLRKNADVQEALRSIGTGADCVLVHDTMSDVLKATQSDPRQHAVAELAAIGLVRGENIDRAFPQADWQCLRKSLAEGNTEDILSLVRGESLPAVMLRMISVCPSPGTGAGRWLGEVERSYWAPFRSAVLCGDVEGISNSLSLLAVIDHMTGQPRWDECLEPFKELLDLTEARLEALRQAVLKLDDKALRQSVCVDQAKVVVGEFLSRPIPRMDLNPAYLGFEDTTSMQRWFAEQLLPSGEDWESQSLQIVYDLTRAGVMGLQDDQGRVLRLLAEVVGGSSARVVEFAIKDDQDERPAFNMGELLDVCRKHRAVLSGYLPDIDRRLASVMSDWHDELAHQITREGACSSHCGLEVIWQVLSGKKQPTEIVAQYDLTQPALGRLEEMFCAGDIESLQKEISVRLASAPAQWQRTDRTFVSMLWEQRTIRIFAAIIVVLVTGYLIMHFILNASPEVMAQTDGQLTVSTESIDSVLKEQNMVLADIRTAQGQPIYISKAPVSYRKYVQFMGEPRLVDLRQVGSSAEGPVTCAGYLQASDFCLRLTRDIGARHPCLATVAMRGYACRLPDYVEAQAVPIPSSTKVEAEWIGLDSSDPTEADLRNLFIPRPVMLIQAPGRAAKPSIQEGDKTTFRFVLAPEDATRHGGN